MDIEGLKKLAEAATPGPWVVRTIDGSLGSVDDKNGDQVAQVSQRGSFKTQTETRHAERKANAAFIAAANPQTVLALIRELEEARKDAERYRWLRNNWTTMQSVATRSTLKIIAGTDKWADFGCEVIDTAIDAAREKQG